MTNFENEIVDHEFPWIVTQLEGTHDGFPEMTCTRCGKKDGTNHWISFLEIHSMCEPSEPLRS